MEVLWGIGIGHSLAQLNGRGRMNANKKHSIRHWTTTLVARQVAPLLPQIRTR